jgi:hypothetical protein
LRPTAAFGPTFVPWPAHDTAQLTEAFRRAVLRHFVRRGFLEREDAEAMRAWPHSGFHVHAAVLVPGGDLAFALRLARYCARNPVALERLEYDARARELRSRSDTTDGPTAGTETVDPLDFLARLTAHIPNQHQVMTRYDGYDGYDGNRVRGARKHLVAASTDAPPVAEPVPRPLREARRRWAELLRQLFEVDSLRCPTCGRELRIVAFIDPARRDRPNSRPSPPDSRLGPWPATDTVASPAPRPRTSRVRLSRSGAVSTVLTQTHVPRRPAGTHGLLGCAVGSIAATDRAAAGGRAFPAAPGHARDGRDDSISCPSRP